MTFDALAMHAVRDELAREVIGGHVDDVFLIDARRVALKIFAGKRWTLLLCLDPADSRIYLTQEAPRRGTDAVTPFLLLLRKHVRGSRITAIEQPRLERLLRLRCISYPDGGLPRAVELVAEAMGRRSNVVLLDEDGTIMDALHRAPPSVNPSRPILPHLRYATPAPERKVDPLDPGLASALAVATSAGRNGRRDSPSAPAPSAADVIVRVVAGISPLAAHEALARGAGSPDVAAVGVASWEGIASALRELVAPVETGAWEPSIVWRDGQPLAYAAYRLTQFPDAAARCYPSMSEVLAVTVARPPTAVPFERLKRPLLAALRDRMDQVRRKRSSLERSLASADRADELRAAGEAILAHAHTMPAGATALDFAGKRIDLYPTLSPVENAQAYFRQYADARGAKRAVPPLLESAEAELQYLDEMALHTELAAAESDIAALRRELEAAGVIRPARAPHKPPAQQRQPGGAYRRLTIDGAELLVGLSAVGNEAVTFRLAQPDDIWFHARGVPGAHVILRTGRNSPPEDVITAAAQVAAAHSAERGEARVEVDYAPRKYVRKLRGALPGRVSYRNEATIAVAPVTPDSWTLSPRASVSAGTRRPGRPPARP